MGGPCVRVWSSAEVDGSRAGLPAVLAAEVADGRGAVVTVGAVVA